MIQVYNGISKSNMIHLGKSVDYILTENWNYIQTVHFKVNKIALFL